VRLLCITRSLGEFYQFPGKKVASNFRAGEDVLETVKTEANGAGRGKKGALKTVSNTVGHRKKRRNRSDREKNSIRKAQLPTRGIWRNKEPKAKTSGRMKKKNLFTAGKGNKRSGKYYEKLPGIPERNMETLFCLLSRERSGLRNGL